MTAWMNWIGLDLTKYVCRGLKTKTCGIVSFNERNGTWYVFSRLGKGYLWVGDDPAELGAWLNSEGALFA